MTSPESLRPERTWLVVDDEPSIMPARVVADLPVARFGDDSWPLAALGVPPSVPNPTLKWLPFPVSLRDGFRRAGWLLVNAPTPDHMLSCPGTNTVEWPSAGTIRSVVVHWLDFAAWLDEQGVAALRDVTTADLDRYCKQVNASGMAYNTRGARLRAISRLWAISTNLPATDRLTAASWEGEDLSDYLTGERAMKNENATAVIHPDTMGPLLVWALTFTDALADDVVRASQRYDSATAAHAQKVSAVGRTAADAYLARRLRDGETVLPGKIVVGEPRPDLSYLAALHGGFHPNDLSAALDEQREDFTLDLDAPRPCGSLALAKIDGVAWCHQIDWHDVPRLGQALRTAVLIVTAYLTGMRPAEVLSLPPGCCPPAFVDADGTTTYLLDGRRYKGARTEDGCSDHTGVEQVWTTIKPVADAMDALSGLPSGEYLWSMPRNRDAAMDPGLATERIASFIDLANDLAKRLGLPGKAIPPAPRARSPSAGSGAPSPGTSGDGQAGASRSPSSTGTSASARARATPACARQARSPCSTGSRRRRSWTRSTGSPRSSPTGASSPAPRPSGSPPPRAAPPRSTGRSSAGASSSGSSATRTCACSTTRERSWSASTTPPGPCAGPGVPAPTSRPT